MKNVLLAALVFAACTTAQRVQTEETIAQVLVSDQQEQALGFQVHQELLKKNTKFSENANVKLYVERLSNKLKASAEKDRKVDWQFFVIDDPNTVNAFATPGGRCYIYTGLLKAAANEAEVIGVVGHEMGHVVGRHSARQLVGQYGLQAITKVALGENAGDVATIAAQLAGQGAMLAYGRDMELEADSIGARYASQAGYDPRGLATFFEKLKAKGEQPSILTFLSTHPSNDERIAKVTAQIAAENLSGTELGVDSLKAVQKEIP